MMQLGRRALLVVVLLLVAVGSADAECAWVLWVQDFPGVGWRPTGGFPVATDCLRSLLESVANAYPEPRYHGARASDSMLAIFEGTDLRRLIQCLPDTIDPRGPK
jgi:hypothetical protein